MLEPSPFAARLSAVAQTRLTWQVAGTETGVWRYGPGLSAMSAASTTHGVAPLLIAVHGYRGDHHGLEPVIAHLCQLRPDLEVVSPDLPGFGASGALGEAVGERAVHDVDGYARWLRAFVAEVQDRYPHRPLVVLGHSFGTIVVSAAADSGDVARPGLPAQQYVLINPIAVPALEGPSAVGSQLARLYYRAAARLPRAVGEGLLRNPLIVRGTSIAMVTTPERRLRRWIHQEHDRYFSGFADVDSVVEGFDASIGDNVRAHAAAFTVPTLLIGAQKDPITRVRDLRALADALPDARLVELAGVGHLIHYERPAQAALALADFITEQADDPVPATEAPS